MKLVKRDCPIKMELCNIEEGCLDLVINLNNEEIKLADSYDLGDGFPTLLEVIYRLYGLLPEQNKSAYTDEIKITQVIDGLKMELWVPQKANFYWDANGFTTNWEISKDPFIREDFEIKVKLEISREKDKTKVFTVSYKDFCYALSKALTQTLKIYGINGFHNGYLGADINIRQLLFIKAIALDAKDYIDIFWTKDGDCSDLNKELELLMFDM